MVVWKEFQLINSFTLETSFLGPTRGLYKDCHFTIPILREMGKLFCITLRDYASNEQKVREAITELEQMFPPPKAEEGLSSQFQQIDHNRFGNQFNNGYLGEDMQDDKKTKLKKKTNPTNTGGGKGVAKDSKGSKVQVFEVPSTSSKQSRTNDDGKKLKKVSGQSKKNK